MDPFRNWIVLALILTHHPCLPPSVVGDACMLIIPSWRHHLIQYDGLSAALEVLKIPTAVSPLPDGLWAFLLQRLQVNYLVPKGALVVALET